MDLFQRNRSRTNLQNQQQTSFNKGLTEKSLGSSGRVDKHHTINTLNIKQRKLSCNDEPKDPNMNSLIRDDTSQRRQQQMLSAYSQSTV